GDRVQRPAHLPVPLDVAEVEELDIPAQDLGPPEVLGEDVERMVDRVLALGLRTIPVVSEEVPGLDVVDPALEVEGRPEQGVPVEAQDTLKGLGPAFPVPLLLVGPAPPLDPAAGDERHGGGRKGSSGRDEGRYQGVRHSDPPPRELTSGSITSSPGMRPRKARWIQHHDLAI